MRPEEVTGPERPAPAEAPLRQAITVTWRYDVYFTHDAFAPANATLQRAIAGGTGRVLAVVEEAVARHHPDLCHALAAYCAAAGDVLALAAPVLLLAGGEAAKNDPTGVAAVHQAIEAGRICRHATVLAVGGGAFLDMVGYAAATAHRGVRLVRMPSTTLAQADAGLGVKTAVNAFGKKNFVGTFTPPHAVVNDAALLSTLPDREWRAGAAEAAKVGLIKDAAFVTWLEAAAPALAARDLDAMRHLVRRSAELHLAHIAQGGDPFERGSSRPLDFGHWAAHRLEALSGHAIGHGEAVAIGLALDATYAWLQGWLPAADHRRILALLRALGFTLTAQALAEEGHEGRAPGGLLAGLDEFREHLGGRLTILLPSGIGETFEVNAIDRPAMRRAVAWLLADADNSRTEGREPCQDREGAR
jgi:3-dehydroquinate synthase